MLDPKTSVGTIIGFEIIEGIGSGLLFEPPLIAIQQGVEQDEVGTKAFTIQYWSGGGDLEKLRHLYLTLVSRLTEVSISHDHATPEDLPDTLLDISSYATMSSS